jgi:hypothetical protein
MDTKRLERIEEKLDKVGDRLANIDVTLAGQHVTLYEHIKRTAIIERELLPIKGHVTMLNALVKLAMAASAGVGLAVAVKALFG